MTTIHPLPHGYKAIIETDITPEHPWKDFDGQPPILVFNLDHRSGRLEDYGTELDVRSVFRHIPTRCFGPKLRPQILEALGIEPEDCHRYLDRPQSRARAEDWQNAIAEMLPPENPGSWREARTFFEGLEFLCQLAKIPCKWEESNGYSQGHAAWVFVAALPEWQKDVGWTAKSPKDKPASLQLDLDLWTAWAWGDVYGYSKLIRPDGSETDDSCWGFYGSDHETSGLAENATNAAECDIASLAKEAAAAFEAACRDIATVA